jgi:hypothetical protein
MKKHLSAVRTPLGALIVGAAGLVLLLLTAYGLTRLASRGEVMGRVEVSDTQIGGLDEEQALSALVGVEEEYLGRPALRPASTSTSRRSPMRRCWWGATAT